MNDRREEQSSKQERELEEELASLPRQPKKNFQLRAEGELRRIPDYTRGSQRGSTVRRRMTAFAKVMLGLIIVGLSVFLALAIIFTAQEIFGLNKPEQEIVVDIPQNAGVSQIAEILEERGVIRSADIFKAYFKFLKPESNFQYGSYSLNSSMSYGVIVTELSRYSSTREEVRVSFPEGFTLYQMAQRLEENGVCSAKDFIDAINTSDFGYEFEQEFTRNRLRFHRMEGYAFPDTYFFFKDDNPVNVAKKLVQNFDSRVNEDLRARMKELGYTMEETIIIASIVQQESGKPEEMSRIASVYANRLKNPGAYPNLQADPTRNYAEELALQMNVVNQEILDAYNTYEDAGLPPGPICNPGLDAIKATLYPEETEYFYFCTNLDSSLETRQYYYATTLEEHEQNLRAAGLV